MKELRKIGLVIIASIVFSNTAFAADPQMESLKTKAVVNQVTSTTAKASIAKVQPRGSIIALASAGLSNLGDGSLMMGAMTSSHVVVDRMAMTIYLDRYNEQAGTYSQKKVFEYDFYAEDMADPLFTILDVAEEIDDQEPGYYYRVRGIHAVWKGNTMQGLATQTDLVKLTD